VLLPGRPTLSFEVLPSSRLKAGQPAEVKIRLKDLKGAGVGSLDLLELHTRRLHLFAIDPGLRDYHHEHPITSGRPGEFSVYFTPRQPGEYLVWLDATPIVTGRNEILRARIEGSITSPAKPLLDTQLQAVQDGWHYELTLNPPAPQPGQVVEARLKVTDAQGRPCVVLEPWMGAFAHVIGFHAGGESMLHVHSHGDPPHELMRGGPVVPFRFVLPQAGHWTLFIQTQLDGNVITARFAFKTA
jgi:hypothetical protein